MNIYDISKKSGVSIATVSRVLNGNSKVSEKTRQKVLKVMEETGYRPNVFARGLGLNSMNTIGILCADSSDIVLASAVYHVEQELHKYQYNALLCCTGYEHEKQEQYLELLLTKGVDAVILVGSSFVEADEEKNRYLLEASQSVPIVILNAWLDAPNIYCVLTDDEMLMRKVTAPFLKKNRKLLYLYRSLTYSGRQKLLGVERAFQDIGMEIPEGVLTRFDGTIRETRDFLLKQQEQGREWDVILTSDDELAVGACKYAQAMGMSIPEDIQIVGFNDSLVSACPDPELTTIDSHLDEGSIRMVSVVMRVLRKEPVPNVTKIYGDIILRGTTTDLTGDTI